MLSITKRNVNSPAIFDRDEFLTPFSSLLDEFFNDSFESFGEKFFEHGTYPKVDVRDEDNQLVIEADVPGLTKEQVKVEIDGGILRIKGERKESSEKNNKSYVHRELKRSSFCRSFRIGDNVDSDKLSAKFENGVLEITVPKKVPSVSSPPPRQIEIK